MRCVSVVRESVRLGRLRNGDERWTMRVDIKGNLLK